MIIAARGRSPGQLSSTLGSRIRGAMSSDVAWQPLDDPRKRGITGRKPGSREQDQCGDVGGFAVCAELWRGMPVRAPAPASSGFGPAGPSLAAAERLRSDGRWPVRSGAGRRMVPKGSVWVFSRPFGRHSRCSLWVPEIFENPGNVLRRNSGGEGGGGRRPTRPGAVLRVGVPPPSFDLSSRRAPATARRYRPRRSGHRSRWPA
jgi:hypothetical protein